LTCEGWTSLTRTDDRTEGRTDRQTAKAKTVCLTKILGDIIKGIKVRVKKGAG
jgi:hypothetical protein